MPRPKRLGVLGHSSERHKVETPIRRPKTPANPPGFGTKNSEPLPLYGVGTEGTKQPQKPSVLYPPIPSRAHAPSEPANHDPKRLYWDEEKRAFRLINQPTRCDCANHKSSLTGERLTCGLCDGRATPPKRFRPGPIETACRYCGEAGEGFVCKRCTAIKERLTASGVTADDQILLGAHRTLAAADRREKEEGEIAEVKKTRRANRRRAEKRWARAAE